MLNWIFAFFIIVAVLTAAFGGTMSALTEGSLASAKSAVELAIGLVGQMALWLGFMRVLQDAGFMRTLARGIAPVLRRLMPEVPADHPAMGAMIMNIAANMLGLGNAATPFGLKAMIELDRLNERKGVATNAMALFLAINTSGVAVLPLGVIAVRAALGSEDPAGIIVPTLLATMFSTLAGVTMAKVLERLPIFRPERSPAEVEEAVREVREVERLEDAEEIAATTAETAPGRLVLVVGIWLAVAAAMVLYVRRQPAGLAGFDVARSLLSDWLLPLLMLAIVTAGFSRRTKVYESFIAGAKEAFHIAVMIIPFLVAILVAIGMFRASGAMEVFVRWLSPVTGLVGMPAEVLPMALIRPLSGSGAFAVMSEAMKSAGPDSLVGYMVSVLNGTTETTFYVLAVYLGSVQVRAARHTVWACLTADFVGIVAGVWLTRLFFG